MLPGDDATWDRFMEYADEQFTTGDLSVEEAYMAVRAGIAAIKATRDDVRAMLLDILKLNN